MGNAEYLIRRQGLAAGPRLVEFGTTLAASWPLVGAALGIEAIYLFAVLGPFSLLTNGGKLADLGELTGHQTVSGVGVTVGLIVLFAVYGASLDLILRSRRPSFALVLTGTFIFSLTLVFLYPVTAMDVYNYAVQGHAVTFHHVNPLVTAPATVHGDPFISYGGVWAESTSPYGPLWIGVSTLDSLLAGTDVIRAVLVLKVISALGVVATTALLATTARERGGEPRALAAALFGWNPLVQLELVGNGHNDSMMIALLVLSLILLSGRRGPSGAFALAGSVFVKYLTVVAVPFYLLAQLRGPKRSWRERLPMVLASVGALAATTLLAYAPFWAGPATLDRVRHVDDNYLASFSALALLYIPNVKQWLLPARVALVAGIALWQTRSFILRRASVERAVFEVYFGVLLVATHFAGWYLPMLIALGVLSKDRWLVARAITFSFCAILTVPLWEYLWPEVQNTAGLATFHLLIVPLTFLPPLFVGAWGAIRTGASVRGVGSADGSAVERIGVARI